MKHILSILAALALLLPCTGAENYVYAKKTGDKNMAIALTSIDFVDGGMIPEEHTCDGDDISPSLSWSGVPDGLSRLMPGALRNGMSRLSTTSTCDIELE